MQAKFSLGLYSKVNVALQMQNDYAKGYMLKAAIKQRQLSKIEVIDLYNRAATYEKNEKALLNIYLKLAQAYLDAEQYDKALEICEVGLKKSPKHSGFAFIQGMSTYKLGKLKDAIPILEDATAYYYPKSENKARTHFLLGLVYKHVKNYGMAKNHFHKGMFGSYAPVAEMELSEIEVHIPKAEQ